MLFSNYLYWGRNTIGAEFYTAPTKISVLKVKIFFVTLTKIYIQKCIKNISKNDIADIHYET